MSSVDLSLNMGTKIGTFFSTMASKIKKVVEEEHNHLHNILRNNSKPVDNGKHPSTALPPWLDLPSNADPKVLEEVKQQIQNLATSKRSFINAPPEDINFIFDFDKYLPIAQASLRADSALANARFCLVPKYIREEIFWRNYFYRVWAIKESYGLNRAKEITTSQQIIAFSSPGNDAYPTQDQEQLQNSSHHSHIDYPIGDNQQHRNDKEEEKLALEKDKLSRGERQKGISTTEKSPESNLELSKVTSRRLIDEITKIPQMGPSAFTNNTNSNTNNNNNIRDDRNNQEAQQQKQINYNDLNSKDKESEENEEKSEEEFVSEHFDETWVDVGSIQSELSQLGLAMQVPDIGNNSSSILSIEEFYSDNKGERQWEAELTNALNGEAMDNMDDSFPRKLSVEDAAWEEQLRMELEEDLKEKQYS